MGGHRRQGTQKDKLSTYIEARIQQPFRYDNCIVFRGNCLRFVYNFNRYHAFPSDFTEHVYLNSGPDCPPHLVGVALSHLQLDVR